MPKYFHELSEALVSITHRDKIQEANKKFNKKTVYKQPDKYAGMPNLESNLTHSFYKKFHPNGEP